MGTFLLSSQNPRKEKSPFTALQESCTALLLSTINYEMPEKYIHFFSYGQIQ